MVLDQSLLPSLPRRCWRPRQQHRRSGMPHLKNRPHYTIDHINAIITPTLRPPCLDHVPFHPRDDLAHGPQPQGEHLRPRATGERGGIAQW